MTILDKIKSFLNIRPIDDIDQIRLEILCLTGDSGDGICRNSILECIKNQYDLSSYADDDINLIINTMLHTGELLTDGETIIDPLSIINGAKIIRNGKYLLSYEKIKCPENTCPKCFTKLYDTGKCPYAAPDCWKC